jgi:hypothetical protein
MGTYNDKEIFDLIREIKKEKTKHIELTPGEYARLQNDLKGKAQLGVHIIPNKNKK